MFASLDVTSRVTGSRDEVSIVVAISLFQRAPCEPSGGERDYECDDTMMRDSQRRGDHPRAVKQRISRVVLQILLIQNFVTPKTAAQIAECPPTEVIPGCPCYNFEDGLFLECAGATEETLRTTLQGVLSTSGKRFSINDEKRE